MKLVAFAVGRATNGIVGSPYRSDRTVSAARASASDRCRETTQAASACSWFMRNIGPGTGARCVYVRETPTRKPTPCFHIRYVMWSCGVLPALNPAKCTCSRVERTLDPDEVVIAMPELAR